MDEDINKLGPNSQKFIRGIQEQLADQAKLETLIFQVTDEARCWLLSHTGEVLERLVKKCIKGGQEHGELRWSMPEVYKETQDEYIDLLGWKMVEKFVEENPVNTPLNF